jgi:hypothetical protein
VRDLERLIYRNTTTPKEVLDMNNRVVLVALGEKQRPVQILQSSLRVAERLYMSAESPRLAATYQAVGQFAVGVPGGTEKVARMVQGAHDAGEWIATYDASNAFPTQLPHATLEGLVQVDPLIVNYAADEVFRTDGTMLYQMDSGGHPTVIKRPMGISQGRPASSHFFCAGTYPLMKTNNATRRARGAYPITAFSDDIQSPLGKVLNQAAVDRVKEETAQLLTTGFKVNASKSGIWPPKGHQVTEAERQLVEGELGFNILDPAGIVLLGQPIGEPTFIEQHLREAMDEI